MHTLETKVKGVSHYQEVAQYCHADDELILVPDPNNPHDSNAIRVEHNGFLIGHLSRDLAADLITDVRAGCVKAKVKDVLGANDGYPTGIAIELQIDKSKIGQMCEIEHTHLSVSYQAEKDGLNETLWTGQELALSTEDDGKITVRTASTRYYRPIVAYLDSSQARALTSFVGSDNGVLFITGFDDLGPFQSPERNIAKINLCLEVCRQHVRAASIQKRKAERLAKYLPEEPLEPLPLKISISLSESAEHLREHLLRFAEGSCTAVELGQIALDSYKQQSRRLYPGCEYLDALRIAGVVSLVLMDKSLGTYTYAALTKAYSDTDVPASVLNLLTLLKTEFKPSDEDLRSYMEARRTVPKAIAACLLCEMTQDYMCAPEVEEPYELALLHSLKNLYGMRTVNGYESKYSSTPFNGVNISKDVRGALVHMADKVGLDLGIDSGRYKDLIPTFNFKWKDDLELKKYCTNLLYSAAQMYVFGEGVPLDKDMARYIYRLAEETEKLGYSRTTSRRCLQDLSNDLESNKHTGNLDKSKVDILRLLILELLQSEMALAHAYETCGTHLSCKHAFRLYRRIAQRSDSSASQAKCKIGKLYFLGKGVSQDFDAARYYLSNWDGTFPVDNEAKTILDILSKT